MTSELLMLKSAVIAAFILPFAQVTEASWLQIIRELGSFGLVAFIVWWYATHVAPKSEERFTQAETEGRKDYLSAAQGQRQDYLEAQRIQREDYMKSQDLDREVMRSLVIAMQNLASLTGEHVAQARAVWTVQGALKKEFPSIEKAEIIKP